MRDTRFKPGQSGNPKGRPPKLRRPNVSAFEIVLDKRMTAMIDGKDRELTIDEALQQQTLKDALAGKRLAIRKVLKMIEKREAALAKKSVQRPFTIQTEIHHCANNANEAMRLLQIAEPDPNNSRRWNVNAWATQLALSRPGRRRFSKKDVEDIKLFSNDSAKLNWPRDRIE